LDEPDSAILPLILGSEDAALHAAGVLQDAGFLVPAIRPPTVPRGQSRLRLTLSAAHTSNQIDSLISALQTLGPAIGRAHT
jgi:8-amino-7-oxononanoate synthase